MQGRKARVAQGSAEVAAGAGQGDEVGRQSEGSLSASRTIK